MWSHHRAEMWSMICGTQASMLWAKRHSTSSQHSAPLRWMSKTRASRTWLTTLASSRPKRGTIPMPLSTLANGETRCVFAVVMLIKAQPSTPRARRWRSVTSRYNGSSHCRQHTASGLRIAIQTLPRTTQSMYTMAFVSLRQAQPTTLPTLAIGRRVTLASSRRLRRERPKASRWR